MGKCGQGFFLFYKKSDCKMPALGGYVKESTANPVHEVRIES